MSNQRQFRSDDTSVWQERYGNGADGAGTSIGNTVSQITVSSGSASATFTNGVSFPNGSLILIIQSRNGTTTTGDWELNKVSSGGGTNSITLAYTATHTYDTTAQAILLPQFSSYSGAIGAPYAWDGSTGGVGAFLCTGTATITSGNLNSTGFRGGAEGNNSGSFLASSGEGSTGASFQGSGANGNGGGSGRANDTSASGGGNSASGGGPSGGAPIGNAGLTIIGFGGGGGGLSRDNQGSVGTAGGGIFIVIAKRIVVTAPVSSASVASTLATAGGSPTGSGGTGAGGSFLFKGQTIDLGSALVTASAAASGGGTRSGGQGSVGRIHADYSGTISGTTSPPLGPRLDAILGDAGGAFIYNLI